MPESLELPLVCPDIFSLVFVWLSFFFGQYCCLGFVEVLLSRVQNLRKKKLVECVNGESKEQKMSIMNERL